MATVAVLARDGENDFAFRALLAFRWIQRVLRRLGVVMYCEALRLPLLRLRARTTAILPPVVEANGAVAFGLPGAARVARLEVHIMTRPVSRFYAELVEFSKVLGRHRSLQHAVGQEGPVLAQKMRPIANRKQSVGFVVGVESWLRLQTCLYLSRRDLVAVPTRESHLIDYILVVHHALLEVFQLLRGQLLVWRRVKIAV